MKVEITLLAAGLLLAGCSQAKKVTPAPSVASSEAKAESGMDPRVAAAYSTPSVEARSRNVGWARDQTPTAPVGFTVTRFAEGLSSPRWGYVLPNGDVLVAEARVPIPVVKPSANRITLFRDSNGDGLPDLKTTFLSGLHQPFGMAVVGEWFFVANTDGVWQYPYREGETSITGRGEKILDLPAGGYNQHWTRNLLPMEDGQGLYVTVGSGRNDEEGDLDLPVRAAVHTVKLDGSDFKPLATGLRNPVGMALEPNTRKLWVAVNERDHLGDGLPPDYLTSPQSGGFYGWPYAYWGTHPDPRHAGKRPDLVSSSITPDYALGAHTASLGLTFAPKDSRFPAPFNNGAFIGQHGSWNRSAFVGYKVLFVPFTTDGRPADTKPIDFLTGFIAQPPDVHGRPCGVLFTQRGDLLVMDDDAGMIWRVSPTPESVRPGMPSSE